MVWLSSRWYFKYFTKSCSIVLHISVPTEWYQGAAYNCPCVHHWWSYTRFNLPTLLSHYGCCWLRARSTGPVSVPPLSQTWLLDTDMTLGRGARLRVAPRLAPLTPPGPAPRMTRTRVPQQSQSAGLSPITASTYISLHLDLTTKINYQLLYLVVLFWPFHGAFIIS